MSVSAWVSVASVLTVLSAVDSLMCKEAIDHKLELVKQLGVVLQGTVKPSMYQCIT